MGFATRALVFIAALLFGALVMIDRYYGPFIAGYFGSIHFQTQDVLLWLFGLAFMAGAIYSFLWRPGVAVWRSGLLLMLGAAMIYGEVGNVPWLKELTCNVIERHHSGPCYRPS